MENTFSVTKEGTELSIVLNGQLATANAPALMDELNKYKDQGVTKVSFDATNLTYIASSGIRVVIFAKQKLGGNPEIEFVNCKDEISSVFEMTGIQNYMTFVKK